MKTKRKEAPTWVFSWRPLGQSRFPKILALVAVTTMFAFFLGSVRIRTTEVSPWAVRKAAVIHVLDDADGRALALRAREGGPFPSRFEPFEWDAFAPLEKAAMEAARAPLPAYVPKLRDLSDEVLAAPPLAEVGVAVLPAPGPAQEAVPAAGNTTLAPVILPLSGVPASAIPHELPPFDGAVDAAMTAEPTRFLVRLDAAGNVLDCVALDGGDENGASALEDWLRGITFAPEPAKTSRWIALGVAFTNQASDGPDLD